MALHKHDRLTVDLVAATDSRFGLDFYERTGGGVHVKSVSVGYPAAGAGLRVGDEVVQMNEVAIASLADIDSVLRPTPPSLLTVSIVRTRLRQREPALAGAAVVLLMAAAWSADVRAHVGRVSHTAARMIEQARSLSAALLWPEPPICEFEGTPWQAFGAMPLDDENCVLLLRNFLSEAELLHLHAIRAQTPDLTEPPRGERFQNAALKSRYAKADPVLNAIEERIGNLTGVSPHANDGALYMSVTRPWGRRIYEGGANRLQNLHHDTNTAPSRFATVLMYIHDAQLEGGETLFPCVRPAGDRAAGLSRDAIGEAACERLVARVNESEARILWPSMYKDSFAPGVADYVSALCNAEPRPAGVLRVKPERGSAIMFMSKANSALDAQIAPHTWHGSCKVERGEKLTLQRFKEPHGSKGDARLGTV